MCYVMCIHVLQIKWKQYFEPYVVMKISQTPRYHEGFVGREFNKISQIMEVQARG